MSRSSVSSVSSVTGVSPEKSPLELLRELRAGGDAKSSSGPHRPERWPASRRSPSGKTISEPGPSDRTDATDRTSSSAADSALSAARGSPAHRLEQHWRAAWERARDGFRRQGLDPLPGRVAACAGLELAVEEGRNLSGAGPEQLRRLLADAYSGDLRAQLRCEALAGRQLVEALAAQGTREAGPPADSAEALLQECRRRGVKLWLDGDDLRTDPGPTRIPPRLFERIAARQDELREALRAAGRA